MHACLLQVALATAVGVLNVPLGYFRRGYQRFTYGWYFYLVLSVPVVLYLKVKTGYPGRLVPLLLCGAIFGQVAAGLFPCCREKGAGC